MVLGSPSASLANKLVFWSPDTEDSSHGGDISLDASVAENDIIKAEGGLYGGVSMYVKLFEEMLKEVLDGEGKLFVEDELNCFMKYHRLPYPAKYLFCRLCLRKTDRWHRLSSLKYESELGDGILTALDTLCGRPPAPAGAQDVKPTVDGLDRVFPVLEPVFQFPDEPQVKVEPDPELDNMDNVAEVTAQVEPDIIDLTFDADEGALAEAGPSSSPVYELSTPSSTPRAPDFSVFADDEEQASLFELLDCLTTEELGDIAKQLKLRTKVKRRDVLIESILRSSSTQGTLPFPVLGSRKGKEKAMVQTKLPFSNKSKPLVQTVLRFKPREPYKTQQDRVRDIVMEKLRRCIRLNSDVVALFRRANLVFFRSTQHTPELLTPALLARAKKRAYAAYLYARTPDIWRSRAELLAYEDALATEAEVDALLEFTSGTGYGAGRGARERSTASRTPGLGARWKTPATPGGKVGSVVADISAGARGARGGETEEEESVRVKNARMVKEILECVYPRWQALVSTKPEVEDDDGRRKALQRFECGHILTRVVCKGAYALGILHEYDRELEVLNALLAQTRWRRGRRGRWHERRALLLMNHLRDADHTDVAAETDAAALVGVVAALEDPDTHIVFRPMLERRLTRLEKRLNVRPSERHECAGRLKAAGQVFVVGERVDRRLHLDEAGRVLNKPAEGRAVGSGGLLLWATRKDAKPEELKQEKTSGKSVWKGRDGEDVSVEVLALQHYEDNHGCKGFHCEGRIVTTLFGLLFWDVIFAPVPGAFETRYQAAPLDLAEDTFYYARQALADARLAEIEAGCAAEILERTYDEHHGVVCVGVRWDLFTKADLVGIVKCLDPRALAVICRLMCEDYAGRTGGVPDLIVWNEEEVWAKFVEVKGPGDSLQENQKVWIDVLLQAGTPVEVCHVYEAGSTPKKAKSKAAKEAPTKTPSKRKTLAGQKRKRAVVYSDGEGSERLMESEDEQSVDYSQLDRCVGDESEEELSPVKKRRKRATRAEPESPVPRKVARLNCQPEKLSPRKTRSMSRA
ncbi:VRR-NUC domain-containing protein [Trametes punicea]|nr:VRR-NUC domain-containing protein [Trametes punicea]